MKKFFPILLMSLGASGAFAQSARSDVTVSNDPAKVAAIEQHAQQLKDRAAQQPLAKAKPSAKAKAKAKLKTKKTAATK